MLKVEPESSKVGVQACSAVEMFSAKIELKPIYEVKVEIVHDFCF